MITFLFRKSSVRLLLCSAQGVGIRADPQLQHFSLFQCNRHEPPPVPTGWTPDPRRVWNQIQDQILVVGSGIQGENLGPEQVSHFIGYVCELLYLTERTDFFFSLAKFS